MIGYRIFKLVAFVVIAYVAGSLYWGVTYLLNRGVELLIGPPTHASDLLTRIVGYVITYGYAGLAVATLLFGEQPDEADGA